MNTQIAHDTGSPQTRYESLAVLFAWLTIGYNCLEGAVSAYFGIEEGSVSLAGFGVDSFIEVFSAVFVLWRMRGTFDREKQANTGIAVLFFALAAITAGASVIQLAQQNHPDTSLPGIIVSVASLSFMYFLWKKKLEIGKALASTVVLNDASCALACIKLSGVLFVGSLLFWLSPTLWWVDAAAALVLSYFVFREGLAIYQNRESGGCGGCC